MYPVQDDHLYLTVLQAFLLFVIETTRFKTPSVIKVNKLGAVCYYPCGSNAR